MIDVSKATYPFTREHVEAMAIFVGIEAEKAKRLGDLLVFVAKLTKQPVEAAKEGGRNG